MVVGSMRLQLLLEGIRSLKEKRMVIRSLIERQRSAGGISIAEVEDHDLWGNSTIGVACVGSDVATVESVLARVEAAFADAGTVSVVSVEREVERW
ncbi:MAG: DUF503 domain-containing protein [Fimbriimonas sp.]